MLEKTKNIGKCRWVETNWGKLRCIDMIMSTGNIEISSFDDENYFHCKEGFKENCK